MVTGKKVTTFSALKDRNYRLFWFGMVGAFGGGQVQTLCQSWLVYDMTKSTLALGLVTAMWGIPLLTVALFGGALADRMSKRNLVMIAESSNAVISLIVALLILTNHIAVWQLMLASFLGGLVMTFNVPARQSLIPDLLPKEELLNGIALYSTANNLTRIVGPAVAGILIAVIGVGLVYFLTVGLAVMAVLTMWGVPVRVKPAAKASGSLWAGAKDGFVYVKDNPVISGLLLQSAVVTTLAMPYVYVLPVFAADILKVGSAGLGWLNAMVGIGALTGALVLASSGNLQRKGLIMVMMGMLFGLMVGVFAISRIYPLALAVLLVAGIGYQGYLSLNNTLLQTHSAPEMRARVMSLNVAGYGLTQVGALPLGAVAAVVGAPFALAGSASLVIVLLLVLTWWRPQTSRL